MGNVLERFKDKTPWRTAGKESWAVRTLWGRVFDLGVAVGAMLLAGLLGVGAPFQIAIAGAIGLGVAPALEIGWRRIRGPIKALQTENVDLHVKVERFEQQLQVQRDVKDVRRENSELRARLEFQLDVTVSVAGWYEYLNNFYPSLEVYGVGISGGWIIELQHVKLQNHQDFLIEITCEVNTLENDDKWQQWQMVGQQSSFVIGPQESKTIDKLVFHTQEHTINKREMLLVISDRFSELRKVEKIRNIRLSTPDIVAPPDPESEEAHP